MPEALIQPRRYRDRYPLEEVPPWCGLPLEVHQDGLGGCWDIAYGYVRDWGERSCRLCPFRRPPDGTAREENSPQ